MSETEPAIADLAVAEPAEAAEAVEAEPVKVIAENRIYRFKDFKCIIGIDFGTTFSGSCYSTNPNASKGNTAETSIIHVVNWPGKAGFKGDKTPTVCVYNTQNSQLVEWGHSAVRYWTDNAKKNEHYRKYEKFKLKLKGSAPQQGRTIDVTGNDEKNFHLKATVDYLKAIHDFTCQMVNIQNVNGVTLEKEKTRYLLTVPTQWSDDTRDVMRIIAREAGLITDEDHDNKLLVINESFASTIFCEREPFDDDPMEIYLSENNKARFKETDKYLIVDAGGGTVDLATYECTGPMPNSAERLNGRCQLTVDGGDECGSKFIDDKMLDILLNHLFKNRDPTKTSQTEAYTEYLYPIMTEFINNIKPNFRYIPTEKDEKAYQEQGDEESDEESNAQDEDDDDDDDDDRYQGYRKRDYCIINIDYTNVYKIDSFQPDNKNILIDVEDKSILISKSYIRDVIFEPVVEKTIEEITKQVMKANKAIKKTFLLGGFGLSPYLKQRILMSFRKDANGNRSIGKLIQCKHGDMSAVKGALHYGHELIARKPQTDIITFDYNTDMTKYTILISFDIGYEYSSCAYNILVDGKGDISETVFLKNWPGSKDPDSELICTAYNKDTEKFGNEVGVTGLESEKSFIVPSKLMSKAFGSMSTYLVKLIGYMNKAVVKHIKETHPNVYDENKCRYSMTMENCYKFYQNKTKLRGVAVKCGLIKEDDPKERLGLICRDDATALHFERKDFAHVPFNTAFLQIYFYHDLCYIALHDANAIFGMDDQKPQQFSRNIRRLKSAVFPFNFIIKLINNMDKYISNNKCVTCSTQAPHDTYNDQYFTGLRDGFLDYIKNTLDFSSNSEIQNIVISKAGCCSITITVFDLLEHVFRPTIKDLVGEINRYATQEDMMQRYDFKCIYLLGTLLEAKPETYDFIEKIIKVNLSQSLIKGKSDIVKSADREKTEGIKGAVHHGLDLKSFTHRLSRRTYAINVKGFVPKDTDVFGELRKSYHVSEDLFTPKQYKKEAARVLISDKRVVLGHQPNYQSSKAFDFDHEKEDNRMIPIIRKNVKITDENETKGIYRRFYAYEECVVYATVLAFEHEENDPDVVDLDDPVIKKRCKKIHQFEIFVKKLEKDHKNTAGKARINFEVRLFPLKSEARFEADVNISVPSDIPEYRHRDELYVTQVFHETK